MGLNACRRLPTELDAIGHRGSSAWARRLAKWPLLEVRLELPNHTYPVPRATLYAFSVPLGGSVVNLARKWNPLLISE